MGLSIRIVPASPSLDMVGEPDLTSAYALSGHILLSSTSAPSASERTRPVRLLLTSLELTFEGKSEFVSGPSGYHAARLLNFTKQLLPTTESDAPKPIELTSGVHAPEASADGQWQVLFNVPLPGWLPASTVFGEDDLSGTVYTLFAQASYILLDDNTAPSTWRPWKWNANSAAGARSRTKSVCATPTRICINRYTACLESTFPRAHYMARPHTNPPAVKGRNMIPAEVLSNIQVTTSLPSRISVEDESVPITLRFRSKNTDDVNRRLRLLEFKLDMEQQERYYCSPPQSYTRAYPIPPLAKQPPHMPLLEPHPMETLYTLRLMPSNQEEDGRAARTWSIVQPEHKPTYYFTPEGADEDSDGTGIAPHAESWHKVNVDMPIVSAPSSSTSLLTFFDDDDKPTGGAGLYGPAYQTQTSKPRAIPQPKRPRKLLRPTQCSPFFRVQHQMTVSLICAYTDDRGKERQSDLRFSVPVCFVVPQPEDAPAQDRSVSPLSQAGSMVSDESGSSSPRSGPSMPQTPTHFRSRSSLRAPHEGTSAGDNALRVPIIRPPFPRTHPLGKAALPAYSQLYHANGDWREETFGVLPVYTKNAERAKANGQSAHDRIGMAH